MFHFFKRPQNVGIARIVKKEILEAEEGNAFEEGVKKGASTGYEYGYAEGFDAGREKGYKDGYQQAKQKYIDIYEKQIIAIKENAKKLANESFKRGYDSYEYNKLNVTNDAYDDGYNDGYNDAINVDIEDAYRQGFEKGFNTARDEFSYGYDVDDYDDYEPEYFDKKDLDN